MSPRTAPERRTASRPRRAVVLAGLAAVVVAAVVAGWLVLRHTGGEPPSAAAAPTASDPQPGTYGTSVLPSATAAPSQVPQTVLADVPGKPKVLAPVALDQPVRYGDGASARLVDIRSFTAEAHGVGETSGPALAVVVELTNTSQEPLDLGTVAVNAYLGADGAPAGRLEGDSGLPFGGSLAPGASAQAVYAFTVPQDRRDLVTVTVGVTPDSGTAVFSGAVA